MVRTSISGVPVGHLDHGRRGGRAADGQHAPCRAPPGCRPRCTPTGRAGPRSPAGRTSRRWTAGWAGRQHAVVAGPDLAAGRDVRLAVDAADQRAALAGDEPVRHGDDPGRHRHPALGQGRGRATRWPMPSSAMPITISSASSAAAASAAPSRIRCGPRVRSALSFQDGGSPSVALTTITGGRSCRRHESSTARTLRANGKPAPPRPAQLDPVGEPDQLTGRQRPRSRRAPPGERPGRGGRTRRSPR